jgi:hypothetical protein
MARIADRIPPDARKVPVFSSPALAMAQARETLEALDSRDAAAEPAAGFKEK